ncbi:hypothetical protein RRG08_002396 [Elysia crispata]|uniref:Uncharacterized protein n=1 Tax=Elysia crispata TaxID=231223 RepID=A0AAE0ZFN7_9GAST|nr:hypothetical protein RRG08_002396 [Elysia crispata]
MQQDWSTSPMDAEGLMDLSFARWRTGRLLVLTPEEEWSTCPMDAGGLVDLSCEYNRTGRPVLWTLEDMLTSGIDA